MAELSPPLACQRGEFLCSLPHHQLLVSQKLHIKAFKTQNFSSTEDPTGGYGRVGWKGAEWEACALGAAQSASPSCNSTRANASLEKTPNSDSAMCYLEERRENPKNKQPHTQVLIDGSSPKKDIFKAFQCMKDNTGSTLDYCQHQDPTKTSDPIKPKNK